VVAGLGARGVAGGRCTLRHGAKGIGQEDAAAGAWGPGRERHFYRAAGSGSRSEARRASFTKISVALPIGLEPALARLAYHDHALPFRERTREVQGCERRRRASSFGKLPASCWYGGDTRGCSFR
jgi:hypothetical protein